MNDLKTPPATVDADQLHAWIDALDAVLEELEHDLVRRSIVHLSTLRADLLAAVQPALRSDL